MLPKGQPHAEYHLGSAKDPHALGSLDEPHRDPAGALGADYPQACMLIRSQELYESIPERDYRESLYKPPLPHGILLTFSCRTASSLILQLRSCGDLRSTSKVVGSGLRASPVQGSPKFAAKRRFCEEILVVCSDQTIAARQAKEVSL
jgi:hypothetical protein